MAKAATKSDALSNLNSNGQNPAATPAQLASFETLLAEVRETVRALEGGQLPLEQSINLYAEAAEKIARCQAFLEEAERKAATLLTQGGFERGSATGL